jgi:S-adenosylmethionine decarboxylase
MNGIEWIVEAHGCSPASLADLPLLRTLFQRIIADLKLRPVGEAQWHQFPQTGGITGLCLLAESHLTCHTFPEFGSICINLFCCVPRTDWDFEGILKEMLAAGSVTVRSVVRPYIPSASLSDEHPLATASQPSVGRRAE